MLMLAPTAAPSSSASHTPTDASSAELLAAGRHMALNPAPDRPQPRAWRLIARRRRAGARAEFAIAGGASECIHCADRGARAHGKRQSQLGPDLHVEELLSTN